MKTDHNRLTIFYDGACIACDTEIKHYKRIDRQALLELVDIRATSFEASKYNLNKDEVVQYLHTIDRSTYECLIRH